MNKIDGTVPLVEVAKTHKIKANEVCLFEKKFSLNGIQYDAISQKEDGTMVCFNSGRYFVRKEEK